MKKLFEAIRKRDTALLKKLIEQEVDLEERNEDEDDSSPLSLASLIDDGEANMVKILLMAGANPNSQDASGMTPLHDVSRFSSFSSASLKVAELLIRAGANLNARTQELETPLHFAAEESDAAYIKLLIDNGADVNVINEKGQTPLSLAARCQTNDLSNKTIPLLIKAGADVNLSNPLFKAVSAGKFESVRLLLKAGAKTSGRHSPFEFSLSNIHLGNYIYSSLKSAALMFSDENKADFDEDEHNEVMPGIRNALNCFSEIYQKLDELLDLVQERDVKELFDSIEQLLNDLEAEDLAFVEIDLSKERLHILSPIFNAFWEKSEGLGDHNLEVLCKKYPELLKPHKKDIETFIKEAEKKRDSSLVKFGLFQSEESYLEYFKNYLSGLPSEKIFICGTTRTY